MTALITAWQVATLPALSHSSASCESKQQKKRDLSLQASKEHECNSGHRHQKEKYWRTDKSICEFIFPVDGATVLRTNREIKRFRDPKLKMKRLFKKDRWMKYEVWTEQKSTCLNCWFDDRLQNRWMSHNNKTCGFNKVCWQTLKFCKNWFIPASIHRQKDKIIHALFAKSVCYKNTGCFWFRSTAHW